MVNQMLVKVATLYEAEGRQVPRHRAISKRPSLLGKLVVHDGHDNELRRSVRSAYLRSPDGMPVDVLPRLRDAVVLWIDDGRMTITGFETDVVSNKSTAQSWYVEVCLGDDARVLAPDDDKSPV